MGNMTTRRAGFRPSLFCDQTIGAPYAGDIAGAKKPKARRWTSTAICESMITYFLTNPNRTLGGGKVRQGLGEDREIIPPPIDNLKLISLKKSRYTSKGERLTNHWLRRTRHNFPDATLET